MLDPDTVDLGELATALDDRTPESVWYIHTVDGRVVPGLLDGDDDAWRPVHADGAGTGYRDMAEFVARVHHRRAAELLDRAINGRGAFRRFKDTLAEFPELRESWFRFRDARGRRRALRWLADAGLVDPEAARAVMARHPDPVADDEDVVAALAIDLRTLYGDRLDRVLLLGAREEPDEHEISVLVVLRDLRSAWDELDALDELLWRHAERTGLAVVAVPVTAETLDAAETPLLCRAAAEAVRVA